MTSEKWKKISEIEKNIKYRAKKVIFEHWWCVQCSQTTDFSAHTSCSPHGLCCQCSKNHACSKRKNSKQNIIENVIWKRDNFFNILYYALISGHPGGLTPGTYGGIARDLLLSPIFGLGWGHWTAFALTRQDTWGKTHRFCSITAILKMKDQDHATSFPGPFPWLG